MTSRVGRFVPGWQGPAVVRRQTAIADVPMVAGNTVAPGVKRTPGPAASHACGTWKPRQGPVVPPGRRRSADRKGSPVPWREQDAQEANAGRLKGSRKAGARDRSSSRCCPYNWPDTGPGARLRKQADVWRVSLCKAKCRIRRNRGTSWTPMTVNGTEDVALVWDAVDWRLHEDNVRRLRRRIFKAAKEEDLAKVRSLQKMMLRSWSNTLVSVRQVAQRNTGRVTAGIDGEVALTAPARMALAVRVHRSIRTWKPVPVKRVWTAPASLEAATSVNCPLSYQTPAPYSRFPRTLSAAYPRSMSEAYPHCTRTPSPSWRSSHHRHPATPS